MKHTIKITILLIAMFFVTQLIGLAVIHVYTPTTQTIINQTTGLPENITVSPGLPYGMQPPEITPGISITSIIISMVIAVLLIFLLIRIRAKIFLKVWFFVVVSLALGITLNAVFIHYPFSSWLALIIAVPLAFIKIFKRNIIVHNLTELMIYPGIAAVFVPILNIPALIVLLILISAYDIYAVWKAGFMQKMAMFYINDLKIFSGFFIPFADPRTKKEIKLLKQKYKNAKIPDKVAKKKKLKISLALLGGGDVVFPLIAAGVTLKALGLLPALSVVVFSTIALILLNIAGKRGKWYPAMPFLTAGVFAGLLIGWLITLI